MQNNNEYKQERAKDELPQSAAGKTIMTTEPKFIPANAAKINIDDWSANISVGIKTTVWDGGKKLRDVSRKSSETKTADINQLDARSTIKKTLSSQWNTADVCTMKIEYQDLKIESSDFKISQQETIFKTGYGSETDVLNAKIDKCNQLIEKEKQILSRAVACMTVQYLCQ